jgi:hypothetical protein
MAEVDGKAQEPFTVPAACADFDDWADSDGDHCEKIVRKGWCEQAPDFAVKGVSAQDACCGCGGGVRAKELQSVVLVNGLEYGDHTVTLWKLTEDQAQHGTGGAAVFGGLAADKFLGTPELRPRRLEFVGDSDTSGWCADGNSSSGDSALETENHYQTWAARLARDLNADHQTLAISGIGVKDWPIQQYLANTLPFFDGAKWDASSDHTPDAVIMLIGPNDDNPNSKKFIKAYIELMEQVVSMYKDASTPPKLIHVCGGSMNGFEPCDSIQEANTQFNAGRTDGFKGYYTSMTKTTWDTLNSKSKYQGCDSHYGPLGHEALKSEIIEQVRDVLGWRDAVNV